MGRDARKQDLAGGRRRPVIRRRPAAMIGIGLVSIAAAGAAIGGAASAAVPEFPNNLVVFPNRDFVTVEGYQDHIGETALLKVTRAGQVIGSAEAVVAEGDVAFEVNHPGGACWGAGTNLQVTPDIKAGDKVSISFDGQLAGDTTVQDAAVDATPTLSGSTLTVKGHLGTGVSRTQLEQRVVNPDLTGTDVARRDIRALPGPLTPAAKGGYSSSMTTTGNEFTATYVFDTPATAAIAANGGGERMMSWELEDADGNRQGLTIAELGELGGPGMGGCPAGPADAVAPKPGTASVVRSSDKTEVQVNWAAAVAAPGATPVSGYQVEAIAQGETSPGIHESMGRRTGANATKVTIGDLDAGETYSVEVRSIAGARMSEAFTVEAPQAPSGDITAPLVNASPAPAADGALTEARFVTLTSEANADMYYTTDGSPVIAAGLPSDTAKLYTAPIAITAQTELRFAAFDRAGNFSQGSGTFVPPAQAAPAVAPTLGASTAGQESVTLKWNAIADDSVTGYGVQLYNNTTGLTVGPVRETADRSLTITELTAGTPYSFTVKAKNGGGFGPASARSSALTPSALTDRVTIATAKWKAGDFRVTGSGSFVGATVTIRSGSATGPILGTGPVTAAAAPATGGVYDLRFRNGQAPATRPATIYVVSSQGGVAGPFAVAQG